MTQSQWNSEVFFLIAESGDVEQVDESSELQWVLTAEDLVDSLQESWEGESQ